MKAEDFVRATRVVTTVIGAGVVALAVLAVAWFAYTLLRGKPHISVACTVGGDLFAPARNTCQFTNTGSGPGSTCVVVVLRNRGSEASIESRPTCSGEVPAGDSTERVVMFVDQQRPRQLCPGDMERSCDMEILQLDNSGERSSPNRAASPPPSTTGPTEDEHHTVSTAAGEVLTDCGHLSAGYDYAGNRRPSSWSSWVCTDEESAGERWSYCQELWIRS